MLLAAAPSVTAEPAAGAQATTGPTAFYSDLGTHKLATVAQGTVLAPAGRSGEYVRVTLRGYLATNLLGARARLVRGDRQRHRRAAPSRTVDVGAGVGGDRAGDGVPRVEARRGLDAGGARRVDSPLGARGHRGRRSRSGAGTPHASDGRTVLGTARTPAGCTAGSSDGRGAP